MRIKVNIDWQVPGVAKRAGLAAAALGCFLGGGALVYANVPNAFTKGQTLTADGLNQNFSSLDQKTGFVGAITFSGPACNFSASLPPALTVPYVYSNLILQAGVGCTVKVTPGDLPGASIASPAAVVGPGTILSFKLVGPAGHYMIVANGRLSAINGNTGSMGDRVGCAIEFVDGSSGAVGGYSEFGHIASGVSTNTRYQTIGELNAGFTYSASVNTVISIQAANTMGSTPANTGIETGDAPFEIRVYKF